MSTTDPSDNAAYDPTHRLAGDRVRDELADESAPPSVGVLVQRLSEQIPALVRGELELARAEMTAKGKKAGLGVGLFSVAGVLGWFALGVLIAAAVLGLAEAMPGWAAALIVAVVLLAAAGVAALVGKGAVEKAVPPTPERTVENVRADVDALKGETR